MKRETGDLRQSKTYNRLGPLFFYLASSRWQVAVLPDFFPTH